MLSTVLVLGCGAPYEHLAATAFDERLDQYLARIDFNGDGLEDLLMGGDNPSTTESTPVVVLLSNGDGTFLDGSSAVLAEPVALASGIGVTADFTGDGIDDIALFDAGNGELGQHPEGGYSGGAPQMLVGDVDGQ